MDNIPGCALCIEANLALIFQSLVKTWGKFSLKAFTLEPFARTMTFDFINEISDGSTAAFPSMSRVGKLEGAIIKKLSPLTLRTTIALRVYWSLSDDN